MPYINGINSVRVISILADADFSLTCRAIRHLVFYGCVFLLDIFSFSAIYAATAQFGSTIVSDEEMQRECARYVNTRFSPTLAPTRTSGSAQPSSVTESKGDMPSREQQVCVGRDEIWPKMGKRKQKVSSQISTKQPDIVDGVGLVELYASLKHGLPIKQWAVDHMPELANIDVRRFITFGVIKGFLYRVHKYPYATGLGNPTPLTSLKVPSNGVPNPYFLSTSPKFNRSRMNSTASGMDSSSSAHSRRRKSGQLFINGLATVEPTPAHSTNHSSDENEKDDDEGDRDVADESVDIDDHVLTKYLDGMHCFDQICTELEVCEKDLTARLKTYPGEVLIIHR